MWSRAFLVNMRALDVDIVVPDLGRRRVSKLIRSSDGTHEMQCLKGQVPSSEVFNKEKDHASLQNRRFSLHH